MKLVQLGRGDIELSPELSRSRSSTKQFEERLHASIEEIGLAEPIKVARTPRGTYLVVDGNIRMSAIDAIRKSDPSKFETVPAYEVDYDQRFEVRFQTDIYQDLLPSQLAALVEHLAKTEHIMKVDIARYIGVSPPTVRNYTGLWRMIQRGGLFKRLVELMDVGVIPASNPYAWLRLSTPGIREVLESRAFSDGERAEDWIINRVAQARRGDIRPYPIKDIEVATNDLEPYCYREDEQVRSQKRDLGLRRSQPFKAKDVQDTKAAVEHLKRVSRNSREPVLKGAAKALSGYLK
jgi:hypothetical protein